MGLPAENITDELQVQKQAEHFQSETQKLLAEVEQLPVKTPEDYEYADGQLKEIKKREKEIDADRRSFTKPLDDLKGRIMDRYKPALKVLNDAKRLLERKMLDWNREQERKRREEEARIREQQRKEQEKLQRQAEKAAETGKAEKAEALRQQAEESAQTSVTVQSPVPKTSSSVRKTWKGRVKDTDAIIKAAAEGHPNAKAILQVDEKTLNGLARSLKQNLNIPGVEVYEDQSLSTRT